MFAGRRPRAKLPPLPGSRPGAVPRPTYFGNRSQDRFEQRFKLLEALDAPLRAQPFDEAMSAYADFYGFAKGMMYDPRIPSVFKFTADDDARYGGTQFGRGLVVARNAMRARNCAVFINVTQGGWDTHQNMFDRGYTSNLYQLTRDLDRGVGALVADLKQSGHLDETLIAIMGEFGRTPGLLNARGGRDHHWLAMSAVLLGGVRGGRAIGERVKDPGWSGDRAIYPEDIGATIYSALGVNWTKSIEDTPSGRRFEYIPYALEGQYRPAQEVFG